MLRYTTKDIIQRAEQLSDLENSDFISDREKTALLNEAWARLYQKIVDADDKSFIKTVDAYDGMTLPKDFYQISRLYTRNGFTQVLRRNDEGSSGYELRGNTLRLSRDLCSSCALIMEYFPEPPTLFYSSEKLARTDYDDSDSDEDNRCPKVMLDNGFYLNSYNWIISPNGDALQKAMDGILFRNGIISDGEFKDWNGNTIETRNDRPFVVRGNEITYDDIKGSGIEDYLLCIFDEGGKNHYFVGRDLKVYSESGENTGVTLSASSLVYCREDGLYVATHGGNKITRISGGTVEIFPLSFKRFLAFVDSSSCLVGVGDDIYSASYGFCTILNYPNNIYFQLISYMLAVAFRAKQNGDITVLSAREADAWAQFYESVSKDANTQTTMRNVYKKGAMKWL
jgi:hypothetical protein